MKFKQWLSEVEWPVPWPVRQGYGEEPREQDTPPEVTPEGDYILYHGTCGSFARKILEERRILHDDMQRVGLTTRPHEAANFAVMKWISEGGGDENAGTVLRLVIDKDWFLAQIVEREVGGSGRNTWLLDVKEIPPEAIKDIEIHAIRSTHPPDPEDLQAVTGGPAS